MLPWQPNNGTVNDLTKMTFSNQSIPNNRQIFEQCICCQFRTFAVVLLKKKQTHEITKKNSDLCNHGNQIKQPFAILQEVTRSNENIFLQTKVYKNNAYITYIAVIW